MSKHHIFAEQKVPRYTSYPTAPHFHAGVDADVYGQWLSTIPTGTALSLYFHVPFCTSLCLYCGCHTEVARRKDPIRQYAALLRREIDLVSRRTAARSVTHIHWGGGTPSILGEQALTEIVEQLRGKFSLDSIHEHAIELDPRHVTATMAQTLAQIGINRVSLGVQEFSAHVQAAMGRTQPFVTVRRTVDRLRAAGVQDLNFDLMYGLPAQTTADIRASVEQAVSLKPQRIALFGYAHVPWFRPRQRLINEAELPGVAERFSQMEAARQGLYAGGYDPIGFDHFALPDDELAKAAHGRRLHRNFQGYTTDNTPVLIALGASSIGRLPQGYVQNAPMVADYTARIEANELATVRGVALSDDDRLRGDVIEALMCYLQTDIPAAWSGTEQGAVARDALHALEVDGLVHVKGNHVAVTEAGRPFVRLVAAAFDAYLPSGQAKHSAAV